MSRQSDEAAELIGEAFPQEAPKHSDVRKKDFKPWHLPRKHWVRTKQWATSIGELADSSDVTFRDGRPFRYLTLPGDDLLDIRIVQEVCHNLGLKLKFLGFDSTRDVELHVSRHEVANLPGVHRESVVRRDELHAISDGGSLAKEALHEFGALDAANIDLCNSIAGEQRGCEESSINALATIIEHQSLHRTEPWLLFLTSRVGHQYVDHGVMNSLVDRVKVNTDTSHEFAESLKTSLSIAADSIAACLADPNDVPHAEYFRLFAIGLAKWILNLSLTGEPRWRVEVGVTCCYRVYLSQPDMLSFAFRFVPVRAPVRDRARIVPKRRSFKSSSVDEPELAVSLIDPLASLTDLDDELRSQPKLYNSLLKKSSQLLGAARYDIDSYQEWARKRDSKRKVSLLDAG